MSLALGNVGDQITRFKASPPRYEQTFLTPLNDLKRFVSTLLSPFQDKEAAVLIDTVVFVPYELLEYLATEGFTPQEFLRNVQITAFDEHTLASLLEATLGEWIDFLFLPRSGKFALYADHDEFTTLFSDDLSVIEIIQNAMAKAEFKFIDSYKRF
ncbi:MAG: hypothetical protein V4734_05935 [Terriglobus sp.]